MSQAATSIALTGSDQTVWTGPVLYCGFSIRETAGSTAVLRIYDNTVNSGTLLDTIALGAGESAREWYPGGLRAAIGIRVDIISGAVEGSVRVG